MVILKNSLSHSMIRSLTKKKNIDNKKIKLGYQKALFQKKKKIGY